MTTVEIFLADAPGIKLSFDQKRLNDSQELERIQSHLADSLTCPGEHVLCLKVRRTHYHLKGSTIRGFTISEDAS